MEDNPFLKILTVAAATAAPLGLLLFPLRPWLERRYAPQTRWSLWQGMTWLLVLFGSLMAGTLALPQTTVTVQDRLVSVPTVRVEIPSPFPAPAPEPAVPDGAEAPTAQTPSAQTPSAAGPSHDAEARPAERRLEPLTIVAGRVWTDVATALILIQYFRYFLTKRRLRKASVPTEDFDDLKNEVYARAEIRRLPGLDSPMTMGTVFGPVVFLPEGEVDPLAVRHELTHILRGDLDERHSLFWACAIYWFDPLVWYMARVADQDMEAACDAQVTAGMSLAEKRAYGELLLSAAGGGRAAPLSTRFGGGGKARMKARLAQLFRPGKSSKLIVAAVTVLGVLAVGLAACETAGTLIFSGTVYANVRYDALELDEDGKTTSVPLELVDCVGGLVGDGYETVDYPLSNAVTLDGRTAPQEGWGEKYLFTFLNRPLLSSAFSPGRWILKAEVREGKIAAMEWLEDQTYVGGMLWHTVDVPFALRLPADWRGRFQVVDDGEELAFYRTEGEGKHARLFRIDWAPLSDLDEYRTENDPSGYAKAVTEFAWVLGEGGGNYYRIIIEPEDVWYGERDYSDDAMTYRVMSQEAWAIKVSDFYYLGGGDGAPDAYVNGRYAFTLALPESWRLHWWAREDNDGVDFFYRSGGDFTAEEKAPLFGLLFRKEYIPEENIRTDKLRYIGGGNGVYIYGYWPPEAPASRFRQAGDGIRYHQMYEDLQQMERTGWTLTFGLPDETADGGGAEEPPVAELVEPPAVEADPDARAAFQKVLTDAKYNRRLPDGMELPWERLESDDAARFAVADVDRDGKEELVLLVDPGITAGMMGYVIGYDQDSGETYLQLSEFPRLHFYQGGAVQADASHNQGREKLWPYTLYWHDPQTDSYEAVAAVESWDKARQAVRESGEPFPDWADKSGTGTVYYVLRGAQTVSAATPQDAADYAYWRRQYLGGVERELALDYRAVDRESIASLALG